MKPNWNKIKNEYINGNISQRKLADKHGVSFPTLRDRAKKEGWTKTRDKQHDKIVTRTSQKTAEKISDQLSDETAELEEIARLTRAAIIDKLKKPDKDNIKNLSGVLRDIKEIMREQDTKSSEKRIDDLRSIFTEVDNAVKSDPTKIFNEQTSEDDNS